MSDPNPAITPEAPTAELTATEQAMMEDARRRWSSVRRSRDQESQVVDPDLDVVETRGGRGRHYVRVMRSRSLGFEKKAPGVLQATRRLDTPTTGFARLRMRARRFLLGAPMRTEQAAHERLSKVKALAVLSSDALSSVAYATEQIVFVLGTTAVAAAFGYTIPIAVAIVCLLAIVVMSYRQTIKAYPKGGGSYIVASDNLGHVPGLIAGCALMTSYIMTVAVSVASGTDAIISAAPSMAPYRLAFCVGFVVLLMLGNLRGIKEAGSIFMVPTYLFIIGMVGMILFTIFKISSGGLHSAPTPITPQQHPATLNLLLVLLAFAMGASALTGVEAISDGVPAFKPPEWRNARATLTALGGTLAFMFVGITVITVILGIAAQNPDSKNYQTVISQIAHAAFGGGFLYYYIQFATTGILVLAGNTAFSDFPRLLYFMARDNYAPHQFGRLGDRLAFSNGIIVLSTMSVLALIVSGGIVSSLIPMYAIGVFTAFTLSQLGMVARWLKRRERGWKFGLPMNVLGTMTTFLVLVINAIVNGPHGGFIVVGVVPVLVFITLQIHRHYTEVNQTSTTEIPTTPGAVNPVCIVPIADLDAIALQSLALACAMSDHVVAVHVCDDEEHMAKMRAKWEAWGDHVPLEIIESPYRTVTRPLLAYIDALDRQRDDVTIVIVLPELVATRWWHAILHNQMALRLKAALLFRPGTVVVNVPYHLRRTKRMQRRRRNLETEAL